MKTKKNTSITKNENEQKYILKKQEYQKTYQKGRVPEKMKEKKNTL